MELPRLTIRVLDGVDEVQAFWQWLLEHREWVAVDTETTGLDPWNPRFAVRMVQFGDTSGGWAIDFRAWRGLVSEAFAWMQRHGVRAVWHNALFDMNALLAEGIALDWTLIGDTYVLAAVDGWADESRALKDLGRSRLGEWASVGQSVLSKGMSSNGWTWENVPFGWAPYPMYGVVDTVITAMLWEQWQDRRAIWGPSHDLEVGVLRIASGMMRRGVGIDGGYLADQMDAIAEKEQRIAAYLLEHGIAGPSKNDQIGRALEREGVALTGRTATGRVSVAKDFLSTVDHPIARAVLRQRYLHRLRTTYLSRLMESAGGSLERGLVHPSIQPLEARTGRMSIANPPMQQLPRDDPTARNAVVPRSDGEVLVTADYGQIEMRMWARLTRDEGLADAFRRSDESGEDFFVLLGRDIYADPAFSKKDRRRTLIKGVSYGSIYGAGVDKMAATAGVDPDAMQPIAEALRSRYPSFRSLGMDLVRQESGGWGVDTPFGRRIRVRSADEKRKLPNYLDQGSSAVILKRALLIADAAGLGDALCLPVHDEILLSVGRAEAAEAGRALADSMERAAEYGDSFGVGITASVSEAGDRWGELSK